MNNLFFIVLPYISILVFLISAIKKYKSKDLNPSTQSQTTTCSSGPKFFCVGLSVIFVGHLIGLIFPSLVLAWNSNSVRLLILEVGALGLALASLFSFIFFILKGNADQKDASKNVGIYFLLLLLIVTGISVSHFYKWGSSWGVAVMTPYLRSLLKFSPDISAVQTLHFVVKIHVITAFTVIGILPFTKVFDHLFCCLKNKSSCKAKN